MSRDKAVENKARWPVNSGRHASIPTLSDLLIAYHWPLDRRPFAGSAVSIPYDRTNE
jgi:hypothetical protein